MSNRFTAGAFATLVALLLVPGLSLSGKAWAQPTNMVVFGDSLSDNGNLAALTAGSPQSTALLSPPFDNGRVTNGPVAVEVLNNLLGFPPLEARFVSNGTNYAVAGARAGYPDDPEDRLISLRSQALNYLLDTGGVVSPDTLFMIIIGGNDVRDAARAPTWDAAKNLNKLAVREIRDVVSTLAAAGGKYFVLSLAPDIGKIPETLAIAAATGDANLIPYATAVSDNFNTQLTIRWSNLQRENPDATIVRFNLKRVLRRMIRFPNTDGFEVLDRPCFVLDGASATFDPACNGGADFDKFVFFDFIHPTAAAHAVAGQNMFTFLQRNRIAPPQVSSGSGANGGTSGDKDSADSN